MRRKIHSIVACSTTSVPVPGHRTNGNKPFLGKPRVVQPEVASKGAITFAFCLSYVGKVGEMSAAVAIILDNRSTGGFLYIICLFSF